MNFFRNDSIMKLDFQQALNHSTFIRIIKRIRAPGRLHTLRPRWDHVAFDTIHHPARYH